ncbi:MAG: arsenate reductase ArsC [Desulfatibacillaceae bacterium]|nr:arsenate reductase ArsC [Desulfatibacillaceae bacterium]
MSEKLIRVLFICVANSARSQMAQALLQEMGKGRFEVESAGFEPGPLNPLAVAVMAEVGLDISQNKTQSVFDLYKKGQIYDFVITVCEASHEAKCPVFPGIARRLQWSFADPASFTGSWEERLEKTCKVRDAIRETLSQWIDSFEQPTS